MKIFKQNNINFTNHSFGLSLIIIYYKLYFLQYIFILHIKDIFCNFLLKKKKI